MTERSKYPALSELTARSPAHLVMDLAKFSAENQLRPCSPEEMAEWSDLSAAQRRWLREFSVVWSRAGGTTSQKKPSAGDHAQQSLSTERHLRQPADVVAGKLDSPPRRPPHSTISQMIDDRRVLGQVDAISDSLLSTAWVMLVAVAASGFTVFLASLYLTKAVDAAVAHGGLLWFTGF